jgi:phytoene desaturase
MTKAIVIGSGIAGLATAIRLARQGIRVEIYEASGKAGGKITEHSIDGFRFDSGPSLLTLPELLNDLLDPEYQIKVNKLEIITRYFYPDGLKINAYSDVSKFAEEVESKLSVPAGKVKSYLKKAAEVYELTADLFIFGSFHQLRSLINLKSLRTLINFRKLNAFQSLHRFNLRQLKDERLVQLFDRYATYNGSNPYQTPATLSVISHLEHNQGAYLPEGGMYQITDSLVRQAEKLGVIIYLNEPVRKVEYLKNRISGVWTDGGFKSADVVVSDIDIHRFYSTLLPDPKRLAKINRAERSSSALIFSWGMKGTFPELDVHNIFFSDNYRYEFDCIFKKKTITDDPTIYLYISCRNNSTDAPEGCENWFVMINAPADTGQDWEELIDHSRLCILEKLERQLGTELIYRIVGEEILSPPEISKQTESVNGSLYGSSSNSRYASFNRHANFRKDIKGLYFVGGTVHPGGGIPLCLSSAQIVDGLVKEQF